MSSRLLFFAGVAVGLAVGAGDGKVKSVVGESTVSNAVRVVKGSPVARHLGGVQLWEGGPYWAECNVGATKPEEVGWYFMWGDTTGYVRNADDTEWVSVVDRTTFTFSPVRCPSDGKWPDELRSAGLVDASERKLVPAHDAATRHLGKPWRMPTFGEFHDLFCLCDLTRATRNGVNGRLLTGRGAFASKSLFFPSAGYGCGADLEYSGSGEYYWSSTPNTITLCYAWYFHFFRPTESVTYRHAFRFWGMPVRPVRDGAGGQ